MSITAAFVEGVAGELTRFAGRLAGADASIRAALDATSTGLDGLDTAMSGPRPTGLQAIVRAYVAESREVPAAISAAHDTVARWSATAAVYASELSAAESRVARLRFEAAQAGAPAETLDRLSVAIADVEELGESWLRLCRSFSAELTSAIAMIERANATMLGGGPSGFRTSTGEVTVQSIVATLIGLQPADRSAAVSDMRATWVGSPAALELVLAMAEEVERRRDEPWNAVLAEHGIPLPVEVRPIPSGCRSRTTCTEPTDAAKTKAAGISST